MNKILLKVNVALGSLSMLLAGCHTQKNVVPAEPEQPVIEEPSPAVEPAPPVEPLVCKYGVPAEVYERPVRKYGIPDVRE
ncbi:MAG: hypothetical protein IKP02_06080 [Paludibacteraceae bacterium]|nr:hypothetical protein [Paludibacteraceae bacterium]MBR4705152.1 hypothetical protein [Paludibacteraceae bacterium]